MAHPPDDPAAGGSDPNYPYGGQYPPPGGYGQPSGYPQGGYGGPQSQGGYGGPQGYPPAGQQGSFGPPPPYLQPINTYLWQSIVVTVLCCLPAGIVAIVNATRVSSLQQIGDIQGAQDASEKAKKWCIISVVASLVIGVLYIIFFVVILGATLGNLDTNTTSY
jgi:hypothetical protein